MKITKEQIKEIKKLLPKKGRTEANVLDHYKKEKLNDFPWRILLATKKRKDDSPK